MGVSVGGQCRTVLSSVSLYPTEIKSFVNVFLWIKEPPLPFYFFLFRTFGQLSSACPTLSGCTSWAKHTNMFVCTCLCRSVFAYLLLQSFATGLLFLHHRPPSKSAPCRTIWVYYANASAAAPTSARCKERLCIRPTVYQNAANYLYAK